MKKNNSVTEMSSFKYGYASVCFENAIIMQGMFRQTWVSKDVILQILIPGTK